MNTEALIQYFGASKIKTQINDHPTLLVDARSRYRSKPIAIFFPDHTEDILKLVAFCHAQTPKWAIVTQGGNTGLVGGCVVLEHRTSILLNMSRMNRILKIDPINLSMELEAGVTLENAQQAATDAGLLFPLSLASQSAATIGGNIATNAGGTQVLRYGTMRDLCLGLEVIAATGETLSMMNTLRKNNTGYDLKHLFIGSEGTLGVITKAVLKLYPTALFHHIIWLSTSSLEMVTELFFQTRTQFDADLSAFEYVNPLAMSIVSNHLGKKSPVQANHHGVLLEISTQYNLNASIEAFLQALIDKGLVNHAVLASNPTQAKAFWSFREQISFAQRALGHNIKHDISVPISSIPKFVKDCCHDLNLASNPALQYQPVVFGHIGDGNLHFNVAIHLPDNTDHHLPKKSSNNWDDIANHEATVNQIIYHNVDKYQGSISAEHGIGLLKADRLVSYKSKAEMHLMRQIKNTLDPENIMNPMKVIQI